MLSAVQTSAEQVLSLGNERFVVPELLFQPHGVGLKQQGLADTIASAILKLPEELQGLYWANITVVGGTANLPGFVDRL